MPLYVLCSSHLCRYLGQASDAPRQCPQCGAPFLTFCPSCGFPLIGNLGVNNPKCEMCHQDIRVALDVFALGHVSGGT
jgi:primosomal protein N'